MLLWTQWCGKAAYPVILEIYQRRGLRLRRRRRAGLSGLLLSRGLLPGCAWLRCTGEEAPAHSAGQVRHSHLTKHRPVFYRHTALNTGSEGDRPGSLSLESSLSK
jgi:hypothetical protein